MNILDVSLNSILASELAIFLLNEYIYGVGRQALHLDSTKTISRVIHCAQLAVLPNTSYSAFERAHEIFELFIG